MKSIFKVLKVTLLINFSVSLNIMCMSPASKTPESLQNLSSDEFVKQLESGQLSLDELNSIPEDFKKLIINRFISKLLKLSKNNADAAYLRMLRNTSTDNEFKKQILEHLKKMRADTKYAKAIYDKIISDYNGNIDKAFLELVNDEKPPKKRVLEILVKAGANINAIAERNFGRTVLMLRAFNVDLEKMRDLIELGADINAKDYAGDTVLEWAASNRRDAVAPVKLLIEEYKVNKNSDSMRRALSRAKIAMNRNIAQYLSTFPEATASANEIKNPGRPFIQHY